MSHRKLKLHGLVLAVLWVTPSIAHASISYPEQLKDDLRLKSAPRCTLCHATESGGLKTIDKPFGRTMLQLGLLGNNPESLSAVLADDAKMMLDSDLDGEPDTVELTNGTDPNTGPGGAPPPSIPFPETGCSLRGARTDGTSALWTACLLTLLHVALRQRGRRRHSVRCKT